MPGAIYRAEFVMINDNNTNPHTELSKPEMGSAKAIVATTIAAGTFVYNTVVNEQLTSYAIQGDSIASRNLQNQRAINNEMINVGGTLLAGAMIGGPVGLLTAATGLGIRYLIKNIDYQNQVQQYNASIDVDRFISAREREKISENVRGFR